MAAAYAAIIIRVLSLAKYSSLQLNNTQFSPISVVIAARNESENIKACIDAILGCQYNGDFEIVVVDDHSEDTTAALVDAYAMSNVTCLRSAKLGVLGSKKNAISFGISKSKYPLLALTDADCIVPPDWLDSINSTFTKNDKVHLLLGEVATQYPQGLLREWQFLDTAGMMAITQAGIVSRQWYLANGANLALRRSVWEAVGYPYNTNHRYASGDDITLVQSAQKAGFTIAFLKHHQFTVKTNPIDTWRGLFQQRLRWTSKNVVQSNIAQKLVMGIPLVFASVIIFCFIVSLWRAQYLWTGLSLLLIKCIIDTYFLNSITQDADPRVSASKIPFLSVLHTLYTFIFGWLSFLPLSYQWKGRNTK